MNSLNSHSDFCGVSTVHITISQMGKLRHRVIGRKRPPSPAGIINQGFNSRVCHPNWNHLQIGLPTNPYHAEFWKRLSKIVIISVKCLSSGSYRTSVPPVPFLSFLQTTRAFGNCCTVFNSFIFSL